MTRAWLTAWAVCEDTCDSAALIVSELVTNAIVHTSSRQIVCELRDEDGKVRIAVGDEGRSPGDPSPSVCRDEEEHGRGLLLVAAVCSAWGALETGPGLQVWAELPHEAADRRTGPAADSVRGTGAEWVS
ncbi:ATP-binding protein [Streptomyces sulfonofaciens]